MGNASVPSHPTSFTTRSPINAPVSIVDPARNLSMELVRLSTASKMRNARTSGIFMNVAAPKAPQRSTGSANETSDKPPGFRRTALQEKG